MMKQNQDVVVQTHDLTKKYGQFVALDRLSISLGRGHILGFIGPNGAGKTTAIKILVGLAKPTSGSVTIAGADCQTEARKIKRLVGYMPDVFGFYDNMRVQEYLDFFGAAFKIPRTTRRKRIEEVMEITGSTYMRDRFVESLSHGMKQRVAIARTLLHNPQVLILDEPANGLDPNARIEMRQILLRLADMGKTLIVTSHILPELSRICNVVAIITYGKLRAFGTLDEIMKQVSHKRMMEVQLLNAGNCQRVGQLLSDALGQEGHVTVSEAESLVRFESTHKEGDTARLLASLAKMDLGVSQFHEVVQDLEDVFLTVTRNDQVASGDRQATAAATGGRRR